MQTEKLKAVESGLNRPKVNSLIRDPSITPHPAEAAPDAFGRPREFSNNHCVYTVISPRAGGLSIGVNMNPDQQCNYDCIYCEVDRRTPAGGKSLEIEVMVAELRDELARVVSGSIREDPRYAQLPEGLLTLRHVTLSGDGEPTLCPNFAEAVSAILHLRALGRFPFFKLVLVTNATGLDREQVGQALKLLHSKDEVWAKLDAGSHEYFQKVNRPQVPLSKVMDNIILLGRLRPVVIQSLFPLIDGREPAAEEIEQYLARLRELKAAGTMISLVQVYSATRPVGNDSCGHLPLKSLSRIAKAVRTETGLEAGVF